MEYLSVIGLMQYMNSVYYFVVRAEYFSLLKYYLTIKVSYQWILPE